MRRTPPRYSGRLDSVLASAAIVGGALWAALAVFAHLEARGAISYDAFNRLVTFPLVALNLGLVAVHRSIAPRSTLARAGYITLLLAFGLLVTGNLIEFWGALAFGKVNAYAAYGAAVEHWIGSDIGWMMFAVGMLVAIPGGLMLALALREAVIPLLLRAFVGLIGIGMLAANFVGLGPSLLIVPVFVLYGAGWIALGWCARLSRG